MELFALLYFFIITFSFGFSLPLSFRKEDIVEKTIIRIALGLCVFIVMGALLNLLSISLDWRIFLGLSVLYPLYYMFFLKKEKIQFSFSKQNLGSYFFLVFIFLFALLLYVKGPFSYPYLENDDPWNHAISVNYVAQEKTLNQPGEFTFKYLDPYPPGYQIILGVIRQVAGSTLWILKVLNGLILSLGILFFFFFAKIFIQDVRKAGYATFVLAMIPSYFTHFIWAHGLVISLLFPAFYCLEHIKQDKKWYWIAMLPIASILLSQPSQALKISIFFGLYYGIRTIVEKRFLKEEFFALVGGVFVSLVWWGNRGLAYVMRKASAATGNTAGKYQERLASLDTTSLFGKVLALFSPQSGTASRVYTFSDFFIAKPFGMINVHVGWGMVVSVLVLIGILFACIRYREMFKKDNVWIAITLSWFVYTFLATNAMTFHLPIGWITFRFWLLLAIPTALLASIGFSKVVAFFNGNKILQYGVILLLVVGIFATAGYQKYHQNVKAVWPPGQGWSSQEELQGYLWLKTLPSWTNVFALRTEGKVHGLDAYSCDWCGEVIQFREDILNKTPEQLHDFILDYEYSYIIVSGTDIKQFGKEPMNLFLERIAQSGKFKVAHQTTDFVAFSP